jgi:hypothetical protein
MAGSTPYSQEKKQRAVRKAPTYRPAPAWRMDIPKPDGSKRPSRQPLSPRSGTSRIYAFNCFAAPVERAWHPDGPRQGGAAGREAGAGARVRGGFPFRARSVSVPCGRR